MGLLVLLVLDRELGGEQEALGALVQAHQQVALAQAFQPVVLVDVGFVGVGVHGWTPGAADRSIGRAGGFLSAVFTGRHFWVVAARAPWLVR